MGSEKDAKLLAVIGTLEKAVYRANQQRDTAQSQLAKLQAENERLRGAVERVRAVLNADQRKEAVTVWGIRRLPQTVGALREIRQALAPDDLATRDAAKWFCSNPECKGRGPGPIAECPFCGHEEPLPDDGATRGAAKDGANHD